MIGQTISHYRIVEKLGEGGMGVVYKAEDLKLGRAVALKFLPSHLLESQEHKARFLHEARAAALLDHPNICTIYEIDEVDGQTFLAMACLEGQTLKQKIAARPLPLAEALDIATQIGQGLQAAHEKGIVHRDIKPANIMITRQGAVKIMDFGLAQLSGRTKLTASGMKLGTPAYMSPEQAEGKPADHRSDIWALGVVLYEMISGRVPFAGEVEAAVAYAILRTEPEPPTALRSAVPLELDRIVGKALAKKPQERYQHLDDMLVDLQALRANLSAARTTGSRAAGRPSFRQRWAWAAALPVFLAAAFFVWQAWRPPPVAEPLRAVPLTTLPGMERHPSISPDGNYVAFSWTGARHENTDIHVQQIGSGNPLRLTTDPGDDYNPVWSPDGRWIAFFRGPPTAPTGLRSRELRLMPPLGGAERKLADVRGQDFYPADAYLAWSPDSNSLVVTDSPGEGRPDALFAVSLETGEKRPLTNPQAPVLADTSPAVSPDGRSLVFLRRTTWGAGELHLLPLGAGLSAGGEPSRLTSVELGANFPVWLPHGKEIVFSGKNSLWRLAVSGESAPARIPYVGEDGMMPAIRQSPGKPARLVYVRSFADFNFWRLETSGPAMPASSAPTQAIASTKVEYHCQFSPDGQRVAFTSLRSGDPEIWVSNPDGSNAVQLTSMGAVDSNCPRWSPDGQLIAFSSTGKGEFDVYTVPAAGGQPRRLTSHPAIDLCPSFSRDGEWIYYSSMRSGDYRVWKMPAAGGDPVQVTPNHGGLALESPDGSIYYNTVSTLASVWRLPAAGGEPVKVIDGVVWFNWYLAENGIYYIDRLEGETRLQYLDLLTGKTTTVARNLGEVGAGLTVSPGGKTILFTRMDSSADDLMLVENFR